MVKFKKWMALFTTQFLGVLNDNLLKNLIVFISVLWVSADNKELVISIATAALVLPFLLFSPLASRISAIYPKTRVVELAKLAEIPIMGLSIFSFYNENVVLVIVSLFLMGIQSALYSPAKYGLIKDVGGIEGVSFGSGTMELLTFMGVLIGTFVAGMISDVAAYKNEILSALLMFFAVTGWVSSKRIRAADIKLKENIKSSVLPFVFVKDAFFAAKKIKGLNYTVLGLACFWLIASLLQMNIIIHLPNPDVYNLDNTATSLVMALMAVGIGVGCWIAGVIAKGRVEIGMIPIGGIGMTICLLVLGFAQVSLTTFIVLITTTAFFSGFFKVPLNAWIQERVPSDQLPKMLAYNNNVLFLFILISAGIFNAVTSFGNSYQVFQLTAIITAIITLVILFRIPALMVRFVFFITANLLYKVKIHGRENLPTESGALLICNHISLLDAFVIVASVPRNLRFVMMKALYDHPLFKFWFKKLNMIPVPGSRNKNGFEAFNQACADQINAGHVVCIFPEGELSRNGQLQGFKKGINHIAEKISKPIVPMHMEGLNNSLLTFNFEKGKFNFKFSLKRKEIIVNIGTPRTDKPNAFEMRQVVQELQSQSVLRKMNSGTTNKEELLRTTLRSIMTIRENAAVINLLPGKSKLTELLTQGLSQHLNIQNLGPLDPALLQGTIKESNAKIIFCDAPMASNLAQLKSFGSIDRIFVNGPLMETIKEKLTALGVEVFESLVVEDAIVSVNVPDIQVKDLTGKNFSQKGQKTNSVGKPLPGNAVKLLSSEGKEIKEAHKTGKLQIKGVCTETGEWKSTDINAFMDEEGFLFLPEN